MTATSGRRHLGRQLFRFAVIGVGSTVFSLVLFAVLKTWLSNQPANALALIISTVLNTAANRHFTFDAGGQEGHFGVQVRSLVLLGITWAATALGLAVLDHYHPSAGTGAATLTMAVGSAIATAIRFVLLRKWFAPTPELTAELE
ncbi:GtrA family protein [Calidifontibacter sp. DB0510]|uniref:GtrA family protein n=1 Tax=Metallococcus carri TaxID=1656884 RepID=A0A967B713_9MICO|nr:GtrA family protein [Metallococcus carri]NHN56742.1 GtrA family protein [Metallococcus carri]NOP37881.1 GtrA family protein [Calidifontibacter sp. DB2511S]